MSAITNSQRALRAKCAVEAYVRVYDNPEAPSKEESLRDLLTDLRHYAVSEEIHFFWEDEMARTHFEAEEEEEAT
jgi:hypothetical protein